MQAVPQGYEWVAAAILLLGAAGAALVPLTGFMKEWWAYKKELAASEALKPAVVREVAATAGNSLFDNIAIADLTAAIKDLAAAIRSGTAADEAQHSSELTQFVKKLVDRLEERENEQKKGGGFFSHR